MVQRTFREISMTSPEVVMRQPTKADWRKGCDIVKIYKERYTHILARRISIKPKMLYWRGQHSGSRDIGVTCVRPAKKLMDAQADVM